MQHDVKVGAGELGRLGSVKACERGGIVAEARAVGGERGARDGEGMQARERGVHEAQVHEQCVFREVEGLAGKRLGSIGRHGASFDRRFVRRRAACSLPVRAARVGLTLAIATTGSVAWGKRVVNCY